MKNENMNHKIMVLQLPLKGCTICDHFNFFIMLLQTFSTDFEAWLNFI